MIKQHSFTTFFLAGMTKAPCPKTWRRGDIAGILKIVALLPKSNRAQNHGGDGTAGRDRTQNHHRQGKSFFHP